MSIIENGLVGYWNSKRGINANVWENIAPGTLGKYNGRTTFTTVRPDGMYFNGETAYVTMKLPDELNKVTPFTWEARVNIENLDYGPDVLADGAGQFIMYYAPAASVWQISLSNGTEYNNYPFTPNGSDAFLSFRYDPTTGIGELFNRGISLGTNIYDKNLKMIRDTEFRIGSYDDAWYYPRGIIDGFRIYNRTLTNAEILTNYQNGAEIGLNEAKEPILSGDISLSGNSSFSVTPNKRLNSGSNLGAAADITIIGNRLYSSNLSFSSDSLLSIDGKKIISGASILSSDSLLQVQAGKVISDIIFLTGNSEGDFGFNSITNNSVSLNGEGKINAIGSGIKSAAVYLESMGIVKVESNSNVDLGELFLSAKGDLNLKPTKVVNVLTKLTAESSFISSAVTSDKIEIVLAAGSLLNAEPAKISGISLIKLESSSDTRIDGSLLKNGGLSLEGISELSLLFGETYFETMEVDLFIKRYLSNEMKIIRLLRG